MGTPLLVTLRTSFQESSLILPPNLSVMFIRSVDPGGLVKGERDFAPASGDNALILSGVSKTETT
jgi:hypothetical protein